jgi:hypothetical protein
MRMKKAKMKQEEKLLGLELRVVVIEWLVELELVSNNSNNKMSMIILMRDWEVEISKKRKIKV